MCSCIQVINDTRIVKAQKDYRDSCYEFVMEGLPYLRQEAKLSFKELRIIAESIRDKFIIKKGQLHQVQVNKMDGEIYAFRSKIGLASICHKYELFDDC